MMNEFDKYIKTVNGILNLPENKKSTIETIEYTKEFFSNNRELFKQIVPEHVEGKISCSVFVSYGIRLCAATIGEEIKLLTHQVGYKDTPIFPYRLNDIPENASEHVFSNDSENEESILTSSVLDWSINPKGNIDIFPKNISEMVLPAIKQIKKSIVDYKPLIINILLPPFSEKFTSLDNHEHDINNSIATFDFKNILEKSKLDNMEISFIDYSSIVEIKNLERKYLAIHHSDGKKEFLVFSVFEIVRGHKECLGNVAINLKTQESFILKFYKQNLKIEKKEFLFEEYKLKDELIRFNKVKNKLRIPVDYNSFLGIHTTSFIDNEYILKTNSKTGDKTIDKIIGFFPGTKSMSVAEVCARYLEEPNLYNIALCDMVSIAILLERHKEIFQSSTLKTKRKDKITPVQNTEFIHYESTLLPYLPANYARIGWKLNYVKPLKIIPYHKIEYKHDIRLITESIINHFDDCTTDDVIEEYMFIHMENKKNALCSLPSALSAAKMFFEIINMDTIKKNFYNEIVF